MTRVTLDFGDSMQGEVMQSVSSDVNFASHGFPKYMLGPNNMIIEPHEGPKKPSLKEIVAKETAQLLEQHQRVSVRDLAKKFEKGLSTATKLSDEARWREVTSLDRQVLLKKLRDLLESLRGRVAGRNRDDVDEAITMVEALAVQLTQREGELLQEKAEVKKLAAILKKASEDAKKVAEEERAFARAEIENARAVVQRIEEALHEQEKKSKSSEQRDLEELMQEVQEARRIKMLHQPSKVMDMEHELQALRGQLAEKSGKIIKLQREISLNKRREQNESLLYELEGLECLGSCLCILPRTETAPNLANCSIQWYRVQPEESKKELISGATKSIYASEPFDVGRFLQAEIVFNDEKIILKTSGPIDPAAGLGSYVEALIRKPETQFNVIIVQMNGRDHPSHAIHVFHVGKMRIKLCKGTKTKTKESYSNSMQLCGVRGAGNAAAQALYWQAKRGLSYILAFESVRERNAAIMLARRYAFDCNIMLAGPGERSSV
ncbi:stomatal closure-related actin-binding protein 1 [Dioscorea cayenensis subsp. rotundata]|uniref:Stomatal closure-related actin-binding protein 1 n=1 Tax=Dioscorea cayennensis subsp. rotundata TaxID=55577 RepID=A0AB40C9W8_DIOCR|nr:stomatal closure-related actin-binding protein 1 [Dioscorea cayenensis subsp. rotundata]